MAWWATGLVACVGWLVATGQVSGGDDSALRSGHGGRPDEQLIDTKIALVPGNSSTAPLSVSSCR